MSKKFIYISLFLIVLFGGFIRFYHLGTLPSGFHFDEASLGYNAYSLLLTGKDEYGVKYPLVLQSFGDYKPALYAYMDIPLVKMWGLTIFATRFPSALFGTLSILIMFFLARQITQKDKDALLASLLLAITPWHIFISRTATEATVALFFLMSIFALALYMHAQKNIKYWAIALVVLCSGIAILTYAGARLFVPMLLVLAFFLPRAKKAFYISLVSAFVIVVLGILWYNKSASITRFDQVSIFTKEDTQAAMSLQIREEGSVSPLITRIFHNKLVNYTRVFLYDYDQYMSLDFLALHGGYPPRIHIADLGEFYLWEIPFLLIGVYMVFRQKKTIWFVILAWWLILLAPAASTSDAIPNVYRASPVIPAIVLLITYGISQFRLGKYNKLLFAAIILAGIFEFGYGVNQYSVHGEVHQPWYQGYTYKELDSILHTYDGQPYAHYLITKYNSTPYIYLLFYDKYNPALYQSQGSPRDLLNFSSFGRYMFTEESCPSTLSTEQLKHGVTSTNTVFVDAGICDESGNNSGLTKTTRLIRWQDGSESFYVVTYK